MGLEIYLSKECTSPPGIGKFYDKRTTFWNRHVSMDKELWGARHGIDGTSVSEDVTTNVAVV